MTDEEKAAAEAAQLELPGGPEDADAQAKADAKAAAQAAGGGEETAEEKAAREAQETADKDAADKAAEEERKKAARGESESAVAKALTDLAASLRPQMTPQQMAELETQTAEARGISVEALRGQRQEAQNIAVQAQIPLATRLGKELAAKVFSDCSEEDQAVLIKDLEENMKKLPFQAQADPDLWQEGAYLALGKNMKTLKPKAAGGNGGGNGGRVLTPGSGLSSVKRGAALPATAAKRYDANEQFVINAQFGGDAKEYEKYRTQKGTTAIEKFKAESGANRADQELQKMTAQNT